MVEPDKKKINPCPVCGGTDIMRDINQEIDSEHPLTYLACNCGLTSPDSKLIDLEDNWNNIYLDNSVTGTDKLQNCPHCNSKDIIQDGLGQVYCNDCGLATPDEYSKDDDNARLIWNRMRIKEK